MKKMIVMTVCAPALLWGCGKTDKTPELSELSLPPVEVTLEKVSITDGSDAEAIEMIRGVIDSTDDLTYGSLEGEDGHYIFEDISIYYPRDNQTITVDRLTVTGLTLVDDQLRFSGVEVIGTRAEEMADQPELMSVDRFVVSDPGESWYRFAAADVIENGAQPDFGPVEDWDFSLGIYALEGVDSSFKGYGETGSMRFDRFVVKDVTTDGIGALIFDNFYVDVASPDADIEISLDNLDLRGLTVIYLELFKDEDERRPIRELYLDQVDAAGVIKNFELKVANFTPGYNDRVDVTWPGLRYFSDLDGDVINGYLKMDPLVTTVDGNSPDMQEFKTVMNNLGLKELSFHAGMTSRIDLKNDRMIIDEYYYQFDDLARLDMDLDVSGMLVYTDKIMELYGAMLDASIDEDGNFDFDSIDEEAVSEQAFGSEEEMQIMMENLGLYSASLTLTDLGGVERGIKLAAMEQDVSKEVVRSQMKGAIGMMSMASPQPYFRNLLIDASDAMTAIVDGDKTSVTIAMRPKKPVNMKMIEPYMETEDFSDFDWGLLGLEVTSK